MNIHDFFQSFKAFLVEEDGPTGVEYAVMIALIIVVCVGAIQGLAQATRESLDTSAQAIGENL